MPSHIGVFLALAEALRIRGHEITFFGIAGNAGRIRQQSFDFQLLEPDSVPPGTLDRMIQEMATQGNFGAMRLQGRFDELRYESILRKGPAMVKTANLDALIVDQAEACSGSVADLTGLPWVSVCSGLNLNSEDLVPPFFTSWMYSDSGNALARNRLAYAAMRVASRKLKDLINRHRKSWGLAPLANFDATFSSFAQISQQVREFDFPRRKLPDSFHYVGPIRRAQPPAVSFDSSRLDGRPLIYASLGTVANRHERLYLMIVRACAGVDAQLVLSLGGAGNTLRSAGLPGSPVVVDFAPQRELLSRAALAITHAGLNSTLESLSEKVPMVAIPITFEQPGIAARIQWTGAGVSIPSSSANVARLHAAVKKVLHEPSYHAAASRIGDAIAQSGGAAEAARIIEEVVRTGKPVSRTTAVPNPASRQYGA